MNKVITEVLDRPTVLVTARPKTTADILEAAAMVIEEFGWLQGDEGDSSRGFCAWGAIRQVGDKTDYAPLLTFARTIGSGSIGKWNDAPGRQQYEVTAALREAAKRARAVTTRSAQDES